MTYLLGGGLVGAVGVLGIAVVLIYKMHRSNKGDLKDVIETERELNKARRTIQSRDQSIAERDQAIKKLEDSVDREQAARQVAERALGRAREKLEKVGDAETVVAEINASLDRFGRLSSGDDRAPVNELPTEVSNVSETGAAKNRDN